MSIEKANLVKDAAYSIWYVNAMERLVEVVQDLSLARDINSIAEIVRQVARELTGADGATFVLKDDDKCFYLEENAISPLWKGQRFPLKTCISGWVMINKTAAMIEDIYSDPRIPHDAYRPTFVKSLLMVPVRKKNPNAAIGNYWATKHMPTAEEAAILQALADVTSVALENAGLYMELQKKVRALEASNYELSRYAWIAAHDLKAPLQAIDHLSQQIERDDADKLSQSSKDHFYTIRRRTGRLQELLEDVLNYAEIEQQMDIEKSELADGKTIIEDLKSMIYVPDGFQLKIHQRFEEITAARLPLLRVLSCLIDNAVKHHDKSKGVITLDVDEHEAQYIFVLRDDGPGIPHEFHNLIFEMFQTVPGQEKEGSGVGLAIAKKIITSFGGVITLDSDPGKGAAFCFTWPRPLRKAEKN